MPNAAVKWVLCVALCQHQLDEATENEEDMAARIEALESELAATNVRAWPLPFYCRFEHIR